MRFQVNEILPVIAITFVGNTDGSNMLFKPFYPWRGDVIERFEFEHLTVAEHHRVRSNYDLESADPGYDGYVLKSATGEAWFNQFPVARVGEFSGLSDGHDRLFLRKLKTEADWREWYQNSPEVPCQYRLLSDYLADLKRGIDDRNEIADQKDQDREHTAQLQMHLNNMITQYEAQFGKAINFTKSDFGFWEVSFAEKVETTA